MHGKGRMVKEKDATHRLGHEYRPNRFFDDQLDRTGDKWRAFISM